MTDVDPLASPTTELGTTAAANNPLASPDLSLPAPSWVLARPRDSGFPVPAGRATTRGLGLVGRGESVRRPGSLPRSLPDTRLPPLPLEERSRPGPLAVSPFPGPFRVLLRGVLIVAALVMFLCWRWLPTFVCLDMVVDEAYCPANLIHCFKQMLEWSTQIPESTCPDFGAIQNRNDICLSNGRW